MHDKRVVLTYVKKEMKRISSRFTGFVTFKKPKKKVFPRLITRAKKPKESFIKLVTQIKRTRAFHTEK